MGIIDWLLLLLSHSLAYYVGVRYARSRKVQFRIRPPALSPLDNQLVCVLHDKHLSQELSRQIFRGVIHPDVIRKQHGLDFRYYELVSTSQGVGIYREKVE